MINRWIYLPEPELEIVEQLSSEINVNPIISKILVQRKISDFKSAKSFFRPNLNDLHDPFLMKDMDIAVERLAKAIAKKEKILIYGDYDVDGTTSVALVYGFLKSRAEYINFYINDRDSEGYGISEKGIEFAINQGINLIISIDCGIKASKQIDMANENNIDFIVCDHHTPGEKIPNAIAVLDPKRKDCDYPYNELSGCGIGFKFMEGLCIQNTINKNELYDYLDLLAVSIAADIVHITGENRIFCALGIQKLNQNPSPGLKILKNASAKDKIGISGIVFGISPRINAAGRIGHANEAIRLLTANTEQEAEEYMKIVDANNTTRKDFDSNITIEALEMIKTSQLDARTTVLYKEDWHKGVVGIVASRCIEHYYKPTIILTESNGLATGSARSVIGFDIYEALLSCSEWLEKFGGHKYAAGLSLKIENLESFKQAFEEKVASTIQEESLSPSITIDSKLDFNSISKKFMNIIEQMGPFGPGNMAPIFESENVFVLPKTLKILKDKHIKFKIGQKESANNFDAIGFNLSDYYDKINQSNSFRVVYTIEKNDFYGDSQIQINIKDIKID